MATCVLMTGTISKERLISAMIEEYRGKKGAISAVSTNTNTIEKNN